MSDLVSNQDAPRAAESKPAYLTKKEAAQELRISLRTLDSWMARRFLPFRKLGRTVRFRREDLANVGVEIGPVCSGS